MASSAKSGQPQAGPSEEPPPSFQESQKAAVPTFKTQFACVTLNRTDRIRFINFPASDVTAIQSVVQKNWTQGIHSQRIYGQSQEIKVNGMPWGTNWNGNDGARILLLRVLEGLFNIGWVLQAAVDVSSKDGDKDSLLFRKQDPPPPLCKWISISFDKHDKLKIVGELPRDFSSELVKAFGTAVQSHEATQTRLKIHFHGSPWWPSGEETVVTRVKLLTLLECLERFGFTVYASIDQQNSNDGQETDVIVCHRQSDWIPGAPIWHR